MGDRGRLILPGPVRKRLGLHRGDRLVLMVEDSGEMRLISRSAQVQRCAGLFRHLVPAGTSVSGELMDERRREAAEENKG